MADSTSLPKLESLVGLPFNVSTATPKTGHWSVTSHELNGHIRIKYTGNISIMMSPKPNRYDIHVCFFKALASSGQLGTCVMVVCHVFDFSAALGVGTSSDSSSIGLGMNCCWSGCPRELVFAAMVADARSQEKLHWADETSA